MFSGLWYSEKKVKKIVEERLNDTIRWKSRKATT
jgi:hypothetical protein